MDDRWKDVYNKQKKKATNYFSLFSQLNYPFHSTADTDPDVLWRYDDATLCGVYMMVIFGYTDT